MQMGQVGHCRGQEDGQPLTYWEEMLKRWQRGEHLWPSKGRSAESSTSSRFSCTKALRSSKERLSTVCPQELATYTDAGQPHLLYTSYSSHQSQD